MSGCDWQKKKFSVPALRSKDYDRIFGKKKSIKELCNSVTRIIGKTSLIRFIRDKLKWSE